MHEGRYGTRQGITTTTTTAAPDHHQGRAEMSRPQAEDLDARGSANCKAKSSHPGGDSGIGRAVAIAFAKEGADVAIAYLSEHGDAQETRGLVEKEGRRCIAMAGDVGDERFCQQIVQDTVRELGRLDILVNNAAEQHPQDDIAKVTSAQLERTFRTNVFSFFYMTKAALPHLREGSAIINTTSVTAYRGSAHLLDYAATKGAIVAFTRSASKGDGGAAAMPRPMGGPGNDLDAAIPLTFHTKRRFGVRQLRGADVPDAAGPGSRRTVATELRLPGLGCRILHDRPPPRQILHPNGGDGGNNGEVGGHG